MRGSVFPCCSLGNVALQGHQWDVFFLFFPFSEVVPFLGNGRTRKKPASLTPISFGQLPLHWAMWSISPAACFRKARPKMPAVDMPGPKGSFPAQEMGIDINPRKGPQIWPPLTGNLRVPWCSPMAQWSSRDLGIF